MLHKKGKQFQALGGALTEAHFVTLISASLRAEFAHSRNATSTIMRWTGASQRSAKNWLSGEHGPSGANLMLLARHSPAVRRVIFEIAGMPALVLAEGLADLRRDLQTAVRQIDLVIGDAAPS